MYSARFSLLLNNLASKSIVPEVFSILHISVAISSSFLFFLTLTSASGTTNYGDRDRYLSGLGHCIFLVFIWNGPILKLLKYISVEA